MLLLLESRKRNMMDQRKRLNQTIHVCRLIFARYFSSGYIHFVSGASAVKNLENQIQTMLNRKTELDRVQEDLRSDLEQVKKQRVALVKKENNQELNEEEQSAITEVKQAYATFFEQLPEESDSEVETSVEYKERKQAGEVINYIKQELASHNIEMYKLTKIFNDVCKVYSYKVDEYNKSNAESSNSVNKEGEDQSIAGSSSSIGVKRSIESVSEPFYPAKKKIKIESNSEPYSVSNKETKATVQQSTSTNDYIDSLPTHYNPFDDIGED